MKKNIKQENNFKKILKLAVLLLLCAAVIETGIEKSELIVFGVEIDGVSVGGYTREKAVKKLTEKASLNAEDNVVLVVGEKKYPYTKAELGLELDIDAAVEKAYLVGRQGNIWERFKRRKDYDEIKIDGKWNYTTFVNNIQPLANLYSSVPVGSRVLSYDENGMTVAPEQDGKYMDINHIFQQLQSCGAGDVEIVVRFSPWYSYPTEDNLVGWNFNHQLVEFATNYDPESNRGKNIEIFAAKLNGKMLYPYEVFSVNETAGERTASKGYLQAPIIINGRLDEDVGGGICQVVTTLYNAVCRSNFVILERHPHSKAPGYVEKGMDAAVAYGYKDFRCYYRGKTPVIFKVTAFDGCLRVKICGEDNL
ncbi:MAG: VanW family protein [Bacillota bacterium]|jgi:vancomycin resistance protein YoaR